MECFVVPIITAISPVIVAVITVWLNNRVISFKIENLTKTVEKHNGVVTRVTALEVSNENLEKRVEDLKGNIESLDKAQDKALNTIIQILSKK